MSFDLWFAFVLASLAINFVPGPALLLVEQGFGTLMIGAGGALLASSR